MKYDWQQDRRGLVKIGSFVTLWVSQLMGAIYCDVLFIRSLRGPGYLLSGSTTCVIQAQHCSSRLVFIRRLCRRFWAIRRCHSHLIPTHMCFHHFRKRRSVASMICLQMSKIPLLSPLLSTGIQVRMSKK